MAANNERMSLPQRKNGSNKRNRENQTRIIATLKEMFGSTLESDIIISVAQSCNWKLEPSIDALIILSSNNEPQEEEDEPYIRKYAGVIKELEKDCKNVREVFKKSFMDKMCVDLERTCDSFKQKMEINANESPSNSTSTNPNKVETASLCGLKVEYRPKGMENNSDDDADVVIEEESSDYRIETPEPDRVNVCQFLSTLTQCPPTNTFPKVNYINTPSPPCTPQRQPLSSPSMKSKPDPALTRIESDIQKGYKVLVLMRGAPGCGKSYLARSIVTRLANADYKSHIFSTDDYFSLINRGVYVFDASRLSDAHMYNQNAVLNAMRQGWSPIIVDNTNTQAWEMKPYAHMAVEHGYIVDTLEPTTIWFHNVHELEKRNKHNVPKAKIRSMLDRYEPGISGDRLLRMFSFRYLRNNRPPQMRQLPELPAPVPDELDSLEQKMKNLAMKDNTPTPKRVRKPKRTMILDQLEDMSEGLLDNDSLNMITKAYADLDNNSTTTSTNDSKPLANESWTEGSSYKEENLLNMLKLGAIGSERKVAHVVKNAEENVDSQDIIKSEENDETNLLAIECRDSMHELESEQENIKKDDHQSNVMSQCWDFTLLLNGEQIHSRLDVEPSGMINIISDGSFNGDLTPKNLLIDNDDVTDIHSTTKTSENASPNENLITESKPDSNESSTSAWEENFVTDNQSKEASTSGGSASSSMERVSDVDMSQFELCNSSEAASEKPIVDDVSDGKQPGGGLRSIFSFIRNSFLGNEKDNDSDTRVHHTQETNEKADLSSSDRSPDKLQNSDIPINMSDTELSSALILNNENPLNSSNTDNSSNEDQAVVDLSESEIPKRENVTNFVEELLEASSDFQLVEQLDFTERRITEEKVSNVMSEKTFSEQMKNLQVVAKSEDDDNKVSKEPIHKVFGGKNIFSERMQKTDNVNNNNNTTSKSINNSDSNVDNVNLISWRESPFPLDDVVPSTPESPIIEESKLTTHERETYTDPYDFNVSYIGATDEYKVLNAVNRSINEVNQQLLNASGSPEIPLLRKLMLHKGTMTTTTSVFYDETIFDLEIGTVSDEDRSEELTRHFAHLPAACVLDVYENLCMRDFNWAVDYLNNLLDDDVKIYIEAEQHLSENTDSSSPQQVEIVNERSSGSPQQSSNSDSSSSSNDTYESSPQAQRQQQQQQSPQRSKRDRYKASGENLALKQQLESKVIISEESYRPHTLRVKRWKNRDAKAAKSHTQTEDFFEDLIKFDELNLPDEAVMTTKKPSRLDNPAVEEEVSAEDEENVEEEPEEEEEEMMELTLGYEFIRVLESEFGSANFQTFDGLFPVIQIRRSVAQELHALWIESMQQQLWVMQEQLDAIIAKDAEYARSLEAEEARALAEPEVPNLKEIMDMEMALATYSNDTKRKFRKETHKDMTSRVTQETLHEMFPDYDRDMLYEIFEAHGRNFDETVKVIEENCAGKSTITMADVLKKRKHLIDELQKESTYQTSKRNQLQETVQSRDEACSANYDEDEELLTYDSALDAARESRAEARRQLGLRNENYQKAAEACRKRNPEVAAYYSDVAKLHIRKMEKANLAAASAFLAAQAYVLNADDTLDLHSLHVSEALQTLDIFIDHHLGQLEPGGRKFIFIITGRGQHSSRGQSRIKPAVAKKLNSRNLRFSEVNPGMLKVFLRKLL